MVSWCHIALYTSSNYSINCNHLEGGIVMAELPLAPVKRLIKNAGAERVSEDASALFAEHLEEQATIIAENAVKLANHAGRKTVKADDIKLSVKTLYD